MTLRTSFHRESCPLFVTSEDNRKIVPRGFGSRKNGPEVNFRYHGGLKYTEQTEKSNSVPQNCKSTLVSQGGIKNKIEEKITVERT